MRTSRTRVVDFSSKRPASLLCTKIPPTFETLTPRKGRGLLPLVASEGVGYVLSGARRGNQPRRTQLMALEPLSIGVCSWSLQVTSIPELRRLLDRLGINVVQIACGDPHHADWQEGDRLPEAARAPGFTLTGAMLGFPGEDYTTPQTIQKSGGFGKPGPPPAPPRALSAAPERT